VNGVRQVRARIRNRLVFYAETVRATRQVGAFAPTSTLVATAVARSLAAYAAPRTVLEVGAGTGALTRALLRQLGPGDRLDLCEINPRFARVLQEEFAKLAAPAVRVFADDVDGLPADTRYDVIVSSLPWLNLDPAKVRRILERYDASLRPGGTLCYVDYWGNGVRVLVGSGPERRRLRGVREAMRAFQHRYAYARRVVLWNVPPMCVHELRKPAA
jgi:phosphatidylethanolamine/phosphatidyl-N-methylethanolamine N-methyltransferase